MHMYVYIHICVYMCIYILVYTHTLNIYKNLLDGLKVSQFCSHAVANFVHRVGGQRRRGPVHVKGRRG